MSKQHTFRFGVINEQPLPREAWLAQVRQVESLGFSTFLLRDHFADDYFGAQYAPFSALATAAAITTRLHVGTMVISNDFRHPIILANEAATLDVLSGGRFELGIGAGWLRTEFEAAGMIYDPNGVRVDRLETALPIIKGFWSDQAVTYTGKHYHISGLSGFPKPSANKHVPILIGAGHKRMLGIAGREADIVGVLTSSVASGDIKSVPAERLAESVAQKVQWVREGAQQVSAQRFEQIELSLIPDFIICDNRETAAQSYIQQNGWQDITPQQVFEMPSVFIGTIDEIIADLVAKRQQFGFSYMVIPDSKMDQIAPIVDRLSGC
jgi:probable F420-dependent oxidoreductase